MSLKELDCALLSCKRGKAPGEVGVQYEFYINLNVANRNWLLDCLNGVLRSEEVPSSWADLNMFFFSVINCPMCFNHYYVVRGSVIHSL